METARSAILNMDRRAMRAKQFASQVLKALDEFLPTDRDTRNRIYDRLIDDAYKSNALIICLPDEYDALSAAAAEKAMIERMMKPFTQVFTQGATPNE